MSKKKRRRQQKAIPRPQPPKPSLGRFYRHYKREIHKYTLIAVAVLAVCVAIVAAVSHFRTQSTLAVKQLHLRDAHRNVLLWHFAQALVNYHQAENVDPTDENITREQRLARARLDISHGAGLDPAIKAANAVLQYDTASVVAHASLAQLMYGGGNLTSASEQAHLSRQFAESQNDSAGLFASALTLSSYFRDVDIYDSSYYFGRLAADLASSLEDTAASGFALSAQGFAALRLERLREAESLFCQVRAVAGSISPFFTDIAEIGLAGYFDKTGEPDSAVFYASSVESRNPPSAPTEIAAEAAQVHGRALSARGDFAGALAKFDSSLQSWQKVGSMADVIENLSDLAKTYYQQKDYFNARKYYLAAGKLAHKYDFPKKDTYSDDMNLRFLKSLSHSDYLLAGSEGEALFQKYATK